MNRASATTEYVASLWTRRDDVASLDEFSLSDNEMRAFRSAWGPCEADHIGIYWPRNETS